MDFKSIDWKAFLNKLADPKSAGDLNSFLEKLPYHAGQTVLIAAGIAWAMAAVFGLYTTMQTQKLTELRAELKETQALKPNVPKIKNVPVKKAEIGKFLKKTEGLYRGLNIKQNNASVQITSVRTVNFTEFREAIGHIQNGGSGWRVTLEKLCVGRECGKQHKLGASLKINKVSVEKPG